MITNSGEITPAVSARRPTQRSLSVTKMPTVGLVSEQRSRKLKVLDLFAGAGGFSEGFIDAGCEMVAHVEMDKDACNTIRTRMIYHSLKAKKRLDEYLGYVLGRKTLPQIISDHDLQREYESVIQAKIGEDNYVDLINDVKSRLQGDPLDIIIGGPPCQAYSSIGRGSDPRHMRRDPRKHLYVYYVEFLKALQPKVFVFENVYGLITSRDGHYLREMRRSMKAAGYETDYQVLNTADYGVPQERKRVILIGWSKSSGIKSYPEFKKVYRNYRVSDFITDLPKMKSGEAFADREFRSESKLLQELGIVNQKVPVLLSHSSRPNTARDLEIYRIAVQKKNAGGKLKYPELPKRLITHANQTGFLDRFKVVDWKAASSHTVIAHISKDGHHYIHPDIRQNRSLTSREAARLQTFPDDFKFEGSRTAQFRQIGNAVPPHLSKIIAKRILESITYVQDKKTE